MATKKQAKVPAKKKTLFIPKFIPEGEYPNKIGAVDQGEGAILLSIKNKGNSQKLVNLFGWCFRFKHPRAIVISNTLDPNMSYETLIRLLSLGTFQITNFRIVFPAKNVIFYKKSSIFLSHKTALSSTLTHTCTEIGKYIHADQKQKNAIDVDFFKGRILQGNGFFGIPVQANSEIQLSINVRSIKN